jgi:uncharacterized protein
VRSSIEDLLRVTTMALATTGEDGEPHSASVFFAADEHLNLHFFSDPGSQHGLDVARDPRAAVSFYPESQRWQDIRGLQMRGAVFPTASGPGWERAWEIYAAKFPFVTELKHVVAQNQFYVFTPHWIRLVDNRQGFGYKAEWLRPAKTGPEHGDMPWHRTGPGGDEPSTGGGDGE